jgi:nitrite reductase (NADH) small subunit
MAVVRVGPARDIRPGTGTLVEGPSAALAVFNAGGRFYAVSTACPHEDGPLAEGWIEGATVVCPWHGFSFDLATGACLVDDRLAIATYPVRVVDGALEVEVP